MRWLATLNDQLLHKYQVRLVGGFDEPYYQPADDLSAIAEIRFCYDYERSALHELSHWCLAGERRRLLPDYGYWYVSGQRTEQQQSDFFKVEVKPQALEKFFCGILGVPFEVSVDNFCEVNAQDICSFKRAVDLKCLDYHASGLSASADVVASFLINIR